MNKLDPKWVSVIQGLQAIEKPGYVCQPVSDAVRCRYQKSGGA